MTEFSPMQLKTIDQYRTHHNISFDVSNEAVAEQILAEMRAYGVSYAGFESLISEVGSKSVISERECPSLFEYGFTTDCSDGFVKGDTKPTKASFTKAEYNEAMEFAKQYLLESTTTVHETLIQYKKDIGYISAGAVWHGFKNILNLWDRLFQSDNIATLWEKIGFAEKEMKEAQKLASIDKKQKGRFEFVFKQNQGVDFDVAEVQNFKTKSEEYVFVKACKNQYDLLNDGIRELQGLLVREKQLERFGQNNVSVEKEKSFDERFINILDQYCGGDDDMRNQLILEISGNIKSKDELEKKYLEVLNKLKDNAQKLYESQLNGKDFEKYHSEYVSSYKETFGGEDPETEVQAWIAKQEAGTQAIRIAAVIAATTLTGGSSALANAATKLTAKIGATATQQIIKFGMTLEGVGVGVGLDYLNALTSETGLTEERNQQILQNAVHTLPYALFGAYASGPLGDKIASAFQGSATLPNILNNAIAISAKGVGFTTEVGLDVVFEAALRDGELSEIIKGNINGEAQARALNMLMQMVAGGRAHYATKTIMKNAGIKNCEVKADGGVKVETTGGKVYDVKSEEAPEFIARILGKALEVEGAKLEGVKHDDVKSEESANANEVVKNTAQVEVKIKSEIEKLSYIQHLKSDESLFNEITNDIYKIITQDGCKDVSVLNKRLQQLDWTFLDEFCYPLEENALFLLENKTTIYEIKDNIKKTFVWNTNYILRAINEDNIGKVLEVSRQIKNGNIENRYYLDYLQYKKLETKEITISDIPVDVNTRVILYLLSGRQYAGELNFNKEIEKLFIESSDTREKKGYGKALTGILMQKPELLEIVNVLKGKPAEDAFKIINEYCEKHPTLTLNKFSAGTTMEAGTAVGAFNYMLMYLEEAPEFIARSLGKATLETPPQKQ